MEHTIAAISTSTMSSGGISIVRLSGVDAVEIADKIFEAKNKKKLKDARSHTIHYGVIKDGDEVIDEVLVSVMRAPDTYTREDVIEINCHGGILVTRRVLDTVLKNGAKPAEPGEFTKRAFLNGRIDLSQAEAVIDIINARNDYALKSSVNQLGGKLSEKIKKIREIILDNVAFIESALDDPEHYDINDNVDKMCTDVDNCVESVDKLLKTADNGRIMRDGIRTVILGKTNAGKSSLLNALAREERAIVTDIEGTTRDVLEEQINLSGVTLNLIDTAGIRKTDDYVENIGVNKAKQYAKDADLITYVIDSSRPLDNNGEVSVGNYIFTMGGIDLDKLDSLCKKYENKQSEVTYTNNSVTVKVNGSSTDDYVMVPIIKSDNWTVTVNGEKCETKDIAGMFTGVSVNSGENEIVFTFKPAAKDKGLLISVLVLIAMIAIMVVDHYKNIRIPGWMQACASGVYMAIIVVLAVLMFAIPLVASIIVNIRYVLGI